MREGYIKRTTSTIPFGYLRVKSRSQVKIKKLLVKNYMIVLQVAELDTEASSFLKPIEPEPELEALQVAENMVVNEEISLQAACDWLEYKTDRRMSAPGLKKHIDKKYGLRSERLGTEPTSLLAR